MCIGAACAYLSLLLSFTVWGPTCTVCSILSQVCLNVYFIEHLFQSCVGFRSVLSMHGIAAATRSTAWLSNDGE